MRLRSSSRRDDRGAAAVEFALVLFPLIIIVMGVISYGFMLNFRQSLSQAASEGARAAAVQLDASQRIPSAQAAVADALEGNNKTCSSAGMTCEIEGPVPCGGDQCMIVTVSYAYRTNPIVPTFPLVDLTLPENIQYAATVRVS